MPKSNREPVLFFQKGSNVSRVLFVEDKSGNIVLNFL